ncbi:cerevisin [Cryptococcus neoformans C23]|uniref:Cerevisin n=2 Tax=Cryptococcus neoformans TaxID=5207 RepID=A0A854QDP1_CRYNE|nr:cerevisin [Cryptococcus neoformans var. grubii H99]AUB27623.1 cerevisin [Cryptococcus neoformans var. grubii]OWZ28195.1 cerevisin [Cryptococcus neoformans var. grubii AD2-60a]OWZ40510.1 cerevisin [Cryptococcus neoformans var. grubii C23]OWZ51411.1 cerevisin [Cryptococcus neoformans var. grubii 125.91]OXC82323.1 cerevisin [Cryptococcus neoformans var. grubii AD1-7a]OXG13844.1 cerevisin [Cryptococcus neoformans var. grubii Tu259-1]OXG46436.1 cerevisin [Cryptococcus neoformans var. grubii Th|eukprot:XP_012052107.1 cerevisin [Cryptococcus neoformans var. grubii H99]
MRFTAASLLLLPLAALASPIAQPSLAPLEAPSGGDHIDDAYIVVFKKGVDVNQIALHIGEVQELHAASPLHNSFTDDGQVDEGGLRHVYSPPSPSATSGFFGYAGKFSPSTLDAIRAAPEVDYVEKDQIMTTLEVPRGVDDDVSGEQVDFSASDITTELGAPWGLARISHRNRLTLSTFQKYIYYSGGGEGVTAYVIDTGINIEHVEFEGRASWGKTIPKNDVDKDGNGHGTHCAGTIGSRKYGVAKNAQLVAVKVLGSNGSGTMSDVIAGVLWAAEQAAIDAEKAAREVATTGKTKHKGSVANMSLGGGRAKTLDDAVDAAVEAGLHFAVAAGNDNKDACNYSPAASKFAVTVGASTLGDERAYFSNYGKCVDVFAPGLNILSTWIGGNSTTNTISGTSMASPHVCGLLAYLLSIYGTETFPAIGKDLDESLAATGPSIVSTAYAQAYAMLPSLAQAVLPKPELLPVPPKNDTLTPTMLKEALLKLATSGKLSDLPSETPNLLAYNNATSSQSK